MKKFALMLSVFAAGSFVISQARACTTFVLEGGGKIYFGRNLDWHWESGFVFVNQRNIRKNAIVAPGSQGAKWTSKYGNVTFNQFGLDVPFGGMNEKGLVVENMWLDETKYPAPDSRPGINLAQWIQYQLDNCATIDEVLATDKKIRLEPLAVPAGIHYLVCDANGDCATVEFLDGKMVVHHGGNLPFHVLANDTYESSEQFAKEHPDKGEGKPLQDPTSLARFDRAAVCAADFKPRSEKKDVAYAFNALDQVRQQNFTVWQIVYDITDKKIYFRTRKNPSERVVDLKALDFSCGHPLQFANIETGAGSNKILELKAQSPATLQDYLQTFYTQESVKRLFGDLTPLIGLQVMELQNYSCAN